MTEPFLEYKVLKSNPDTFETQLNRLVQEGWIVQQFCAYGDYGYVICLLVKENQLELRSPTGATL